MAGPFDKFQSPWHSMRERTDIEDRRDDPWPWHQLSKSQPGMSWTGGALSDQIIGALQGQEIPPITNKLQLDAGTRDVGPIAPDELMKFLLDVESYNPDPPGRKVSNGRR